MSQNIEVAEDRSLSAVAHLVSHLKQAVKADATWIRARKPLVRKLQREGAPAARAEQSTLAKTRVAARARLVVYGLARGRTWGAVENNHPEGDPALAWWVLKVWHEAQAGTSAATGIQVPVPEGLLTCLPASLARGL